MSWRRERWSADHSLPIGVTKRAQVGELVRAGDIIAAGATLAAALRVPGARRLGLSRLPISIASSARAGRQRRGRRDRVARVGRRFARSVHAAHRWSLCTHGRRDVYIAPIVDRSWPCERRSTVLISRSDDAIVRSTGLSVVPPGCGAYDPTHRRAHARVDGSERDLASTRIDVLPRGSDIVGGAACR